MRKEVKSEEAINLLKELLKEGRVKLDCGHHFCFHNLSNTLVIHNSGKMECSECYQ
ncbi:MAG: hypothetical protein HQK76_20080 [Desulfobacterales bacterium]|nr:hypothetical protein [Desulfobacterales bacterium]